MKQYYSAALAALLLPAVPALASNFHPLHPGVRYEYRQTGSTGDMTFSTRARMAAPGPQSPDSVYALLGQEITTGAGTGVCVGASHKVGPTGLFGRQMHVRNGFAYRAEYELTGTNGRLFVLKPRAALGQSWVAMPGLTAQVTARGLGTVLGQPDSVVTISLSDGQIMRIGKKYGYLSGPALGHYLDPRTPARQIELAAYNELGTAVTGPKVIFDYQPGDVFVHYFRQETQVQFLCTERWSRDSVLSRRVNGDSIIYRIWQRTYSKSHGVANAPGPFCQATGSYLAPARIITLAVTSDSPAPQAQLSGTFLVNGTGGPLGTPGTLVFPASRNSALYNGRYQQQVMQLNILGTQNGDSLCLNSMLDNGQTNVYAAGLGMVRSTGFSFGNLSETTLLGYIKNTPTGLETGGQLPRFAQLLPARSARPAATTAAFPNPFADELTVRFELTQAQPVALELHDALGRTVLTRAAAPLPAGSAALTVTTGALPAGLYTLHLRFVGDGRQEVLKVLKK